jgi:LysM repeat protein
MADLLSGAIGKLANMVGGQLQGGGGGQMEKARLHVIEGKPFDDLVFLYNPETIEVSKTVDFKEHRTQSLDAGQLEYTSGLSRTLSVSEVIFDTYDTKENVRSKYINTLEALTQNDPSLGSKGSGSAGRPPKVLLVWGKFMAETDPYNSCPWYVKKVTVNYTMFLNDGTPVRAKVKFDLIEATSVEEALAKKQGQEGSKEVKVKKGDTLEKISTQQYGDPAGWKKIAEANGIDDPMNLAPGSSLKVPPKFG